jgi:hypothetical protein
MIYCAQRRDGPLLPSCVVVSRSNRPYQESRMKRVALALSICTGDCLAHSGHDAPLFHLHSWDWNYPALGVAIAVLTAFALWRSR